MWLALYSLVVISKLLCFVTGAHSTVFEAIVKPPDDWEFVEEAQSDEPIHLEIHLCQQNVEAFEQSLLDISTPSHIKYGQHLSREETNKLLRPSDEATTAILKTLHENSIHVVSQQQDYMQFTTTVGVANKLFNANFSWFSTDSYGKESVLQPNCTELDNSNATDKNGVPKYCNCYITPECLLKLYNVYYTADPNNTNKAAYASFLGDRAIYSDLLLFQQYYAPYTKGQNFSVVDLVPYGKKLASHDSGNGEANLDNQYLLSVSYPTPITEYITGGCPPVVKTPAYPAYACNNEPYLRFLNALLALPNAELPQTLSISYGENEINWPRAMAIRVCNKFAQLGARGVSVLAGSGDGGPGFGCTNIENTTLMFQPDFPASCPWLTAVGGTEYIDPEQAAYFSGGGFSNFFSRPSYQAEAVPPFLKRQGSKQKPYYNASGRGIPDVAAQGYGFLTYDGGQDTSNEGTSDATPTFAGIVALLNSARLSAGQPPLGFLNPFLYGEGAGGLNDITVGGSMGCYGQIDYAGWNATKGWDAVTGLGTPDFGKLLNLTTPGSCNNEGPIGKNPSGQTC